MRALSAAGRSLWGSLRIVALVVCAAAIVAGMLVVIGRARGQADRARRAQIRLEHVRSATQEIEIITLRSRGQNDKLTAEAALAGFARYRQVVLDVRALRGMDVPSASLRQIDHDIGVAYGYGLNAMAMSRVNPALGRRMALTRFSPALAELARATAVAARRQDAVARAALRRAGIATTGSLILGLVLLVLLGWRLHRLQRGSALAEQARAAERDGEERLRALVRHSSDVVAVIDASWSVSWIADSVRRMLGHDPEVLRGRPLRELIHPDDVELAERFLAELGPGAIRTASLRLRAADDSYRHLELVADNRVADPLIDGILLNVRDVSERHALLERLHHQAFHDDLTGLPNRALLEDRVIHALARLRRSGGLAAAVFLDLDDFKQVNDGLGHAAGDQLLQAVAGRIRETVRAQDTPARLGGDEFAVLLEDLECEDEARAVAERIGHAIAQPLAVAGRRITPAASIGVASARPTDSHDDLLRNADVAMYAAKQQGKARVAVFEGTMHDRALERFELAGELETALAGKQLELDYQPLIELEGGTITGFEALLRWNNPMRGRLYPDRFIAIAEATGLIVPIGAWVLQTACAQLAHWQRADRQTRRLQISVNVSARQLADELLPGHVRAAIAQSGIEPEQLTVEITEALLVDDGDSMQRQLRELKDIGIRLALDDFGTGFSALSYLRSFPLDAVKLDRSFLAGAREHPDKARLVGDIVEMAHNLGLEVVTEGIEDAADAALARGQRSDFGQGYHFSRPVDADAVERLLSSSLLSGRFIA
jgi:diguanylate cyclase (GGDEF)-like protein/PAS domain S-box-containing protein